MLHTFADHAPHMQAAGWAVLPAVGKSPIRKGFNTWRFRPSAKIIDKWAKEAPDADIVYVPGLCATKLGKRSLIVVDPDDAEAIGQAEELFGDTPGKVRTRRGAHRLYDGAGLDLGNVTSLRPYGLNIDLKHGQNGAGIVVAPYSRHQDDRSFRYAWDGCDETVIRDLPPFPIDKLKALLEKHQPKMKPEPETAVRTGFRCNSRGLGLNDYLVAHAWAWADCDTHAERMAAAIDKAQQFNEDLPRLGRETLDGDDIEKRTAQVVKDLEAGKIERFHAKRATCTSDADEIRALCEFSSNGDSAFTLLQLLRAEHGDRCKRGETFRIVIPAMAEANVLGRWSWRKYREARDLLLELGLIREVSPATPKRAAEYILADRILVPSLSARAA